MRLSRNRNWGHPRLLDYLERLASDARALDGWPGLLVGDMAQPRGGPMITGHASHQIGLDADIWLTPMPDHILTPQEREDISAVSMLKDPFTVDPNDLDAAAHQADQARGILSAGRRIFVHPAIKKVLCEQAGKNRAWLSKGASLVEPLLPLPRTPHLPAWRGRLRQPEAGRKRRWLRQGARGMVQDAAQGRGCGARRHSAPDAKPAPKKPPLGLERPPGGMHRRAEVAAAASRSVAADGTVPAALKAAAGKDAGPPIPKLDPVALRRRSKAELAKPGKSKPGAKPNVCGAHPLLLGPDVTSIDGRPGIAGRPCRRQSLGRSDLGRRPSPLPVAGPEAAVALHLAWHLRHYAPHARTREGSNRVRSATSSASRWRVCSERPVTGFYRSGCCHTGPEDLGLHTVCVEVTAEFLAFSKARGNDLSTPRPEFGFPGSSPATAGASAPRAGVRRSRPDARRASSSPPRMRRRSSSSSSATSSATPSTSLSALRLRAAMVRGARPAS